MAETSTVGGVISGYCAIGNVNSAMPPASVMMIDSTEAKIGRLMKKLENIEPSIFQHRFTRCCRLCERATMRGAGLRGIFTDHHDHRRPAASDQRAAAAAASAHRSELRPMTVRRHLRSKQPACRPANRS